MLNLTGKYIFRYPTSFRLIKFSHHSLQIKFRTRTDNQAEYKWLAEILSNNFSSEERSKIEFEVLCLRPLLFF